MQMISENLKLLNWQLCQDRNSLFRGHMGPVRYCRFGGERMCIWSVGRRDRMAQSVLPLATSWTVRDRIPTGGRFTAFVQTGRGANPASCTMDNGSLFPKANRPERGVDKPLPTQRRSCRKSRGVRVTLLNIWAFMVCSRVTLPFYLVNNIRQN